MTFPVDSAQESSFENEITAYWDARAGSYSNEVLDELADWRRVAWLDVLREHSGEAFQNAKSQGCPARAIDLGCGPGFFSLLLANDGWFVDAVDSSSEMLKRARNDIASSQADNVAYTCSDLLKLPFDGNVFDLAVSRNVTWIMQDPAAAYAEWLRVLRPGGVLLVFDANWYRYLSDDNLDAQRHGDQDGKMVEGRRLESQATNDQINHCEAIANRLPLTRILRPIWDLEALANLDVSSVVADEDVWMRVWTEGEKSFYRSSPLFLVKAVK